MDWPASDASVYAMIPFRKLRRSVSTENGDISRDYNADTAPIRIGVSRTAIYGHVLVLGAQSEAEPPAKLGYLGPPWSGLRASYRNPRFTGNRLLLWPRDEVLPSIRFRNLLHNFIPMPEKAIHIAFEK